MAKPTMDEKQVTIDPAYMLHVASLIDTQRTAIENCLGSIETDAASLKNLWEGESAAAYQESVAKIGEASQSIVDIIAKYAHDLKEIAFGYITIEQIRKTASQALPADVFD